MINLSLNLSAKKYLIRLALFLSVYSSIIFIQRFIFSYFEYKYFASNDPYLLLILLPTLIFFTIWRWEQIKLLPNYRQRFWQSLIFFILATLLYLTPANYLQTRWQFDLIGSYFLLLYIGHIFLFLSIFNWRFVKIFSRDSLLVVLLLVLFIIFEILISHYWMIFSQLILESLKLLTFFTDIQVNPSTFNIALNGFEVYIGPSCAGIYSMVAFTFLFAITLFLFGQKQTINKLNAFWIWLIGMFFVLLFNIARIFVIIYVGAYYSRDLAINLFHEYLGGVFLLLIFYFALRFAPRFLFKKGTDYISIQ